MVKIIVRNEVLQRVEEERNILRTIKRRKVKFIVHMQHEEIPLKPVTYGKTQGRIEVTGRQKGDVNSFWRSLQKGKDRGNLENKHLIARFGEHAVEKLFVCHRRATR